MQTTTPETIFLSIIITIFSCLLILENIKRNNKNPTRKYKKTTKSKRKKKKQTNPNDYFRNNKYQNHADMTQDYIESIWDEINKK